jgi:hypothetical protein
LTEKERREARHHLQASQISQFMHGEQGALIATSKIVQTVPDLDSKFYAATQVMDEARHVEAYSRLCTRSLSSPTRTAGGLAKARPPGRGMPELVDQSEAMNLFRSRIFSRIVPTVRDIGLWGPRVQQAFAAMGAIEFATVDAAALLDNDARVAAESDARLRVRVAMPQ